MTGDHFPHWTGDIPGGAPELPPELNRLEVRGEAAGLNEHEAEVAFTTLLDTSRQHASPAAEMAWWTLQRFIGGNDPAPMLHAVLRYVLTCEAKGAWGRQADTIAGDVREDDARRDPLVRKLHTAARDMLDKVGLNALFQRAITPADARRQADGDGNPLLWWDDRFAEFLAELGEAGQRAARKTRQEARARWAEVHQQTCLPGEETAGKLWALWWNPGGPHGLCPALVRLADVLWLDRWREVVEKARERERHTPTALLLPFVNRLAQVSTPGGAQLGDHLVDRNGQVVADLRRVDAPLEGLPVATLASMAGLVTQGAELLGTLTAHRLYRWAPTEARRRYLDGDPDPRVLTAEGWRGLADAIGATTNKAQSELPAIVAAGAHLCFPFPPDSIGNLWSWRYTRAAGQRAGRVELVLSTALLPHFGKDTRAKLNRFDRKLVPVLPMPPMVGRPRDWGALAALQLAVLAELRRLAKEVATHGGAVLDWPRLARNTGVGPDILPRVLERWILDGDDGPAFLVQVDRDRHTLANRDAREFIEQAGQRELDGAKRRGKGRGRKK